MLNTSMSPDSAPKLLIDPEFEYSAQDGCKTIEITRHYVTAWVSDSGMMGLFTQEYHCLESSICSHEDDRHFCRDGKLLQSALWYLVWVLDPFDNDGADEFAVDHALGFVDNDTKLRILLVDSVESGDFGFILNHPFQGIGPAGQREESNVGVPLVQKVGNHLGGKEERVLGVFGADTVYTAIFEAWDLIDYFCHIKFFRQK